MKGNVVESQLSGRFLWFDGIMFKHVRYLADSSIYTRFSRLKRIEHVLNVFHARYTFHVIVQNIEVKKFLIQDMQAKYTRNQTITMDF